MVKNLIDFIFLPLRTNHGGNLHSAAYCREGAVTGDVSQAINSKLATVEPSENSAIGLSGAKVYVNANVKSPE
jgi:hypothetical protein